MVRRLVGGGLTKKSACAFMPRSRKYWTEREGMPATLRWICLLGGVMLLVSCRSQQPLTAQQELGMLRREPPAREGVDTQGGSGKQTGEEHVSRVEKEGGKYRSLASFDFKHVAYLLGIQRKIETAFTVPSFAPDHGAVGVPIVGFTIRRNGALVEVVLLRSSGYPTLDLALVTAVRRAAPYPPFPDGLHDQEISVRVCAGAHKGT